MSRIGFAFLVMLFGTSGAEAQMQPAPGQRMFDLVSGIVFNCSTATGYAWTVEACEKITAEFRKRAEASKLPFVEVPITADFSIKKRETAGGFDQDKAVRVFWNFTEEANYKGMIKGGISATRIWEPTEKEIPNVAPGQRFSVPFWVQSASFKRGTRYKDAVEYLDIMTNSFFKIGESRRKE